MIAADRLLETCCKTDGAADHLNGLQAHMDKMLVNIQSRISKKTSNNMNHMEIMEAEAIHKEDALRRIAAMVSRYQITKADLAAILPDATTCGRGDDQTPKSKLFDPFFDVR